MFLPTVTQAKTQLSSYIYTLYISQSYFVLILARDEEVSLHVHLSDVNITAKLICESTTTEEIYNTVRDSC